MVLHVKMQKKTQYLSVINSIKTSLTEAVLNNIGPHPALRLLLDSFSTAKYTFGHRFRPIFVLFLSQRLKSGDFLFMQDSAPYYSAH